MKCDQTDFIDIFELQLSGTAYINAVFPPIPSSKPDANGVASSSQTAGEGSSTNVASFTRKHVLQVSTYQVRLFKNVWTCPQSITLFEMFSDVRTDVIQHTPANDVRGDSARNRHTRKGFDSCTAIVVHGQSCTKATSS